MRILILQDNVEAASRLQFFLESRYGANVSKAKNLDEGLAILREGNPPINLIIFDLASDHADDKLFWTEAAKTPTIMSSERSEINLANSSLVRRIDRKNFSNNLIRSIDDLLSRGMIQSRASTSPHCRIKTEILMGVPLQGDVFIKLSDKKYVKMFRTGDTMDNEDVKKYNVKKGVEYLYIRREACSEFAERYKEELQNLMKADKIPAEVLKNIEENAAGIIQQLTEQIGFTKEVQELAKIQAAITIRSISKSHDLSDILKRLETNKESYITSHSMLTAQMACAIASQIEWGSSATFHKLTLAALLHDMTLSNDELAAVGSLEELEKVKDKYTEEQIKEYKNHPTVVAEMAKGMAGVPPDVDTIIRQHHERPDGSGFPAKLGSKNLAPLTTIFIVAHDMATQKLKLGDSFTLEKFIREMGPKYQLGLFKKVITAIEKESKKIK